MLRNNILLVSDPTPDDMMKSIAYRVRQRRLEMNLTQKGMSAMADITLPSYRRFENTGEISLAALLRIAFVTKTMEEFNLLFANPIYNTLEDVVENNTHKRKRGKRNG